MGNRTTVARALEVGAHTHLRRDKWNPLQMIKF